MGTIKTRYKVEGAAKAKSDLKGIGMAFIAINQAMELASKTIEGMKKAYDFTKMGAEVQKVEFAFKKMVASVGADSKQVLADLKRLSGGTVSEFELMVNASRAATLGLPIDRLAEMMEIARAAAAAMGENTQFMFESIVKGTARQSKLILDNLGIIIDQTAVYKRESEKLGRELTEVEKRQAFFNEVLKQGQTIIKNVGDTSQGAWETFDRFEASAEDLGNTIKDLSAKSFERLVASMAEALEGFKDWLRFSAENTPDYIRDQVEASKTVIKAKREEQKAYNDLLKFQGETLKDRTKLARDWSYNERVREEKERRKEEKKRQLEALGTAEGIIANQLREIDGRRIHESEMLRVGRTSDAQALTQYTLFLNTKQQDAMDAYFQAERALEAADVITAKTEGRFLDSRVERLREFIALQYTINKEAGERAEAQIRVRFANAAKILDLLPTEWQKLGFEAGDSWVRGVIDGFQAAIPARLKEIEKELGVITPKIMIDEDFWKSMLPPEDIYDKLGSMSERQVEVMQEVSLIAENLNVSYAEALELWIKQSLQYQMALADTQALVDLWSGPLTNAIEQAFSGMLEGRAAFEDVGDFMKQIGKDLLRIILQEGIRIGLKKISTWFTKKEVSALSIQLAEEQAISAEMAVQLGLAIAIRVVRGFSQGGTVPFLSQGGQVDYMQGGGQSFRRGRDLIPVMAHEGEKFIPKEKSAPIQGFVSEVGKRGEDMAPAGGTTLIVNFNGDGYSDMEQRKLTNRIKDALDELGLAT